ncbi:MAG: RcpC/CpaB family pilus assembly protein [Acidimicrobiales bacterium]
MSTALAGRGSDVQAERGAAPAVERTLRRRHGLPSGRAVLGGFLVAVAAVGTYAASTASGERPSFVVAARSLHVGQRLGTGDLTTEAMALPGSLSSRLAFRSMSGLEGSVVVAPIRAGELIQAGDVVRATGAPGTRDISFPIEATRALDGNLSPGDRVDVLVTYGTGAAALTKAVVEGSEVVGVSSAGSSIGSSETLVVTLALPTASQALALANSVDAGQVVLVRSTGERGGGYPPYAGASPVSSPGGNQSPLGPGGS